MARLEGSAQARLGLVKRVETGWDMDEIKRVQGMSTLMRGVTSLPGPQSPRVEIGNQSETVLSSGFQLVSPVFPPFYPYEGEKNLGVAKVSVP